MLKKTLEHFTRNPGQPFRVRRLFRKLGFPNHSYGLFRSVLGELEQTGHIARRGRHQYALAEKKTTVVGKLSLTSRGFGFVKVDEETEIFIPVQDTLNALDGDLVRVELRARQRGPNKEGRILQVIQRGRTEFLGRFTMDRFGAWVVPYDRTTSVRFSIPPEHLAEAREDDLVIVELLTWEPFQPEPVGRIKEVLGKPGIDFNDTLLVIRQFDLPTKWSSKALKEAERLSEQAIQTEISRRLDLRHLRTFTIDPVDAADFDDALSIEKLPDGNWRLGVHIADVSFFVPPGSALDRGARKRGNSVYLVGEAIHMLPATLAGDRCSLVPGKPRLTFSCLITLDDEGMVKSYELRPSVILSHARLNYQEAQEIIDGRSEHPLAEDLRIMEMLRRKIFQRRKALGSIDLDIPEPRVELGSDGLPVDIKPRERLVSHRLVEEFMLLANKCVAQELLKGPKERSAVGIFRNHEPPDPEDLRRLRVILQRLRIPARLRLQATGRDFQAVIDEVRNSPYRHFIEKIVLRSMTLAVYGPENKGHFALAFPEYTHFTSPIRRYADLTVHRLLKKKLGFEKDTRYPDRDSLARLSNHLNEREKVAEDAEREHLKMKQLQWLSRHVGEEFEGVISGVTHFGFFVELADTFVEGLVHLRHLDDDWYEYRENEFALFGRRTHRRFQLGDPVRVRVASVSVAEGMADVQLLRHNPQKGKGAER